MRRKLTAHEERMLAVKAAQPSVEQPQQPVRPRRLDKPQPLEAIVDARSRRFAQEPAQMAWDRCADPERMLRALPAVPSLPVLSEQARRAFVMAMGDALWNRSMVRASIAAACACLRDGNVLAAMSALDVVRVFMQPELLLCRAIRGTHPSAPKSFRGE